MSRPGLEVLEHTADCDIDTLILNLSRFMGLVFSWNRWDSHKKQLHGVSE
jgi:hypothetical protein